MEPHSEGDRARKLDKIKKCLALAQSSNPNEAETALRQARKLMQALGLTMDDVRASVVGEVFQRTGKGALRRAPTWVIRLGNLVAEAFECMVLSRRSPEGNGVVFVGVEPAPELAGYAFDVMLRQLTAARKRYLDQLSCAARSVARKQGSLFIDGWLYAVHKKIADFAGMDEETSISVNAYMHKHYPDIPEMKPSRESKAKFSAAEIAAIQAGLAEGAKSTINRAAAMGPSAPRLTQSGPSKAGAEEQLSLL